MPALGESCWSGWIHPTSGLLRKLPLRDHSGVCPVFFFLNRSITPAILKTEASMMPELHWYSCFVNKIRVSVLFTTSVSSLSFHIRPVVEMPYTAAALCYSAVWYYKFFWTSASLVFAKISSQVWRHYSMLLRGYSPVTSTLCLLYHDQCLGRLSH